MCQLPVNPPPSKSGFHPFNSACHFYSKGVGVGSISTSSSTAISSPTVPSSPDSDARHLKFIVIGLLCGAAVLSVIVAILLLVCYRARKCGISNGEDIVIANKILDKWEGVHTGPGKDVPD
ncbi:hypothetical protein DFS33DRAFT_1269267 [Desarmillaria ectypa]|nr:hypothetical protein DFS33DRAFT_1269267 [Desarmillaria ectypa]